MKKIFIKRNEVMKYLVYFVLILLFTLAKTAGGLMPFGLPAFSALVFSGANIIYIFPAYFVGMMLKDISWQNIICAVSPMILFIIAYFVYYKLKKRMSLTAIILVTLLSEVPYVVLEVLYGNIYKCVIEVLISLVMAYIFSVSAHAVIYRGLKFRMSADEKISSMIVISVFALSMYSIDISGVNLLYPFYAFALIFSCYTLGHGAPLFLGTLVGLGACFQGGGTNVFTIFVIMGIVGVMFENIAPYFSAIGILVTFTLGTLYFEYERLWYINVLLVFVALLIYVIIPKKYKLKSVFSTLNTKDIGKSVVNRNRREIATRLYSLSNVFDDMSALLNVENTAIKISDKSIAEDIAKSYCGKCENSRVCFHQLGNDTSEILTNVVASAIRHNHASIIDMPPFITSRCKRLNGLINEVNDKISYAKICENEKISANNSQNMLATEMKGVSDIFLKLGDEYRRPVSFDSSRERRILDELSFHGVDAKEVLVYGEKEDIFVSLIVKKDHAEKKIIKDILSVILRVKLGVVLCDDYADGYVSLTLQPLPRYDIVYYVAKSAREDEEVSGDVTLIKKLKYNQILFALSDGMGSGEGAENVASRTARTVESFYMAGFSSNVVASVTNRMLTNKNKDDYSAVDMMTLDLNNGMAVFMKFGGVYSLIKHNDDFEVIEGHALPLGIIEGAKPYEEKRVLSAGDIVFFFSDGITDVLSVTDIIKESQDKINIEMLASDILNLAKSKGATDDATVMCVKIFSII